MDLNDNHVIKLCIQGTEAEYQKRPDDARALYWQAWESATDDYEACVAAHYVARFQETPEEIFRWNQEALNRAEAVKDDRVKAFYPSLYVNMGKSYELLGNAEEAKRFYALAAELGLEHRI
ncbi:MAG: hypothetical protein H6636_02285 [Anaerolineales bacterium]|nr:hypothetical protein [Anaerolineales bacterium]